MNYYATFFKNLKLKTKLNVILVVMFLGGIISTKIVLSYFFNLQVESIVAGKAIFAIEAMNAVRNYTSTQIKPELASRLKKEITFVPLSVPAYSAREVFERLKARPEYRDFDYKEATLNPTNIKDKADEFEGEIVERFRSRKGIQEMRGLRTVEGQKYYYVARPLKVKEASCLECHGQPQEAPQSLLNIYGDSNGFGWQLNEIVATQIVNIPISKAFAGTRKMQRSLMSILTLFWGLVLFVISILVRQGAKVKSPATNR